MARFDFHYIRDKPAFDRFLPSLQRLLQCCVNDEPSLSSIGFLAPLSDAAATAYWTGLFPELVREAAPTTLILLTENTSGDHDKGADSVIGTVQIARIPKETHLHRGEIRKLLIHPDHRGSGHGRRLMDAAETTSKNDLGLEILNLDTATETDALGFYRRTAWTEWGTCPDYAMFADGRKAAATFFYKRL